MLTVGACSRSQQEQGPPPQPVAGTIAIGAFNIGYRVEGSGAPAMVIGSSLYYPRVFSRNLRSHLRIAFVGTPKQFQPSCAPLAFRTMSQSA
jgi:hypothetical protein